MPEDLATQEVEQDSEALAEGNTGEDDGSANEGVERRFVEISEALQKAFDDLKDKCARRDLVSYRMQVRDAWEQRYFDRGNQHLVQGPYGQWGFDGETSTCNKSSGNDDGQTPDENNIYLAYRLQLSGVLTQNVPSVRFFPEDNKKHADQVAAASSNSLKQIIERENNTISIQEDIVRFLYTDGLAVVVTEYDDKEGNQKLEVMGALEAKLPMQQNYISECFYAIISKEIDITVAKNKYKSKAEDIKPSTAPAAESEFQRLARVACMQGMRPAAMTGDSLQWNVTEQRTYLKPDAYIEISGDDKELLQQEAKDLFPEGVLLYHCGKTFCGARPARMDDELTLIHAIAGDGMHRNSLGKPLVPIQRKLNNAVELMQQTLLHTIPVKWTHPTYVDLPALAQQKNLPGSYLKLAAIPPNGDMSQAFYVEEQLDVPQSLPQWITELRDNFPQLLTGAYPALTGAGDLGGNDTAQGIATERDAAMGRLGAVWRNMKEGYASIMKNAVICIRENREGVVSANVPGRGGVMRSISVDTADLRGEINCFPETEEAFPESWVQRRGVLMSLLSSTDPMIEKTANLPENLVVIKEVIGVENFYIPQIVSRNKQLAEIDELLDGEAQPNPALDQIDIQVIKTSQQVQANPADQNGPAQLQQLEQQAQSMPEMVSSVGVQKYDDDDTELQTCIMWMQSEEGQQMRKKNPKAFENVELHADEHAAAMKQKAAAQPPQVPQKPISKSVSAGDLLKAGLADDAAQLIAQAGIKPQPPQPVM
jgi:hypothetical protein